MRLVYMGPVILIGGPTTVEAHTCSAVLSLYLLRIPLRWDFHRSQIECLGALVQANDHQS
jgi:hypothetical protein